MKTLVFKSGKSINFIECYKKTEMHKNMQRVVLDFRFNPNDISLNEIDKLFTEEECSKFSIVENNNKFLYENYNKRISISKQEFTFSTETNETKEVEQISLKVAKRTDEEIRLEAFKKNAANLLKEGKITEEQYNEIIK